MKPSKFNIAQPFQGNILLYNTYSTSMLELELELYNNIFVNNNNSFKYEIDRLFSMGFLIDDSLDELV